MLAPPSSFNLACKLKNKEQYMRRIHSISAFGGSQRGFTLIELMIVVALAAVIAAFAIPSYRQHAMKSNRAAAEAFMQQVANRQEQYVLNARTYATSLAALNLSPPADISNKYNIYVWPTPTSTSNVYYTITAVPIGGQTSDTVCGIIALDQTGNKAALCSVDTNNNVSLNTTTTPPTMVCSVSQGSVCW